MELDTKMRVNMMLKYTSVPSDLLGPPIHPLFLDQFPFRAVNAVVYVSSATSGLVHPTLSSERWQSLFGRIIPPFKSGSCDFQL